MPAAPEEQQIREAAAGVARLSQWTTSRSANRTLPRALECAGRGGLCSGPQRWTVVHNGPHRSVSNHGDPSDGGRSGGVPLLDVSGALAVADQRPCPAGMARGTGRLPGEAGLPVVALERAGPSAPRATLRAGFAPARFTGARRAAHPSRRTPRPPRTSPPRGRSGESPHRAAARRLRRAPVIGRIDAQLVAVAPHDVPARGHARRARFGDDLLEAFRVAHLARQPAR